MRKVFYAIVAGALLIAGCGGKSVIPAGNFAGSPNGVNGRSVHTAAMTITETPVPQASSGPTGIVMGPDGNIWFTEYFKNSIAMFNVTTSKIKRFHLATINARPAGITVGPDHNLWFTESIGNKIGKITPAGVITEYPINIAKSDPIGITTGADGNLWFTELDGNRIVSINPTTGNLTGYLVPTPHAHPAFITLGPDGKLYFTENTAGKIGRLSGAGFDEFALATGSNPEGIVTGPDGNLWFTDDALSQVDKMTTTGTVTTYPTLTAGAVPSRITVGPSDLGPAALWFTEANANNIGEITTAGVVSEFPVSTPASLLTGITLGPNNTVWFTEHLGNKLGTVSGI
jgi:streptogramin lyase